MARAADAQGWHGYRLMVSLGLLALAAAGWAVLLAGGHGSAEALSYFHAPATPSWSPSAWVQHLGMWAAMSAGMMLPTALPAVLTFAGIQRAGAGRGGCLRHVVWFVGGYLGVWLGFAAVTSAGQVMLQAGALELSSHAAPAGMVGGALLLAAGVYQWTPWKDACLRQCRRPMTFFMSHWRDGVAGAWRMGLAHGLYCLGCCWLLMALMLVVGVMNLWWMVLMTAGMLAEKIAPRGRLLGRVVGVGLAVWGMALWVLALVPLT